MLNKRKWILWAAISTGSFLVLELPAVFDGVTGGTLSELVWSLPTIWRALIVGFLAWLGIHFAVGDQRRKSS